MGFCSDGPFECMSGVLGAGNSDFLLVSSSRSVGLSLVPIDLMSRIPWWSALPRPEDALPPMAESEVRVGPIKRVDKYQNYFPEVPFSIRPDVQFRYFR